MCEISDRLILVFLILCSVSDIRTKKIPTFLLILMSVVTVMLCVTLSGQNFWNRFWGVGVGVVFWVISRCTGEAVGYGDSWILLLLGGYLGVRIILELVMSAFFLAGIFSLMGIVFGKWGKKVSIPFVPFLTAAYIGVVFI